MKRAQDENRTHILRSAAGRIAILPPELLFTIVNRYIMVAIMERYRLCLEQVLPCLSLEVRNQTCRLSCVHTSFDRIITSALMRDSLFSMIPCSDTKRDGITSLIPLIPVLCNFRQFYLIFPNYSKDIRDRKS